MTKQVLITGGSGFIAHHTILYILKNTDWNIVSLDRLDYSGNLQTSVDGTVWTNQNNVSQNPINGITYGNNIFVAVGDQGTILTSSDLESWNNLVKH